MSGIKGMKHYPIWMKKEAIKLYQEEGWSIAEITKHFEIYDPNRVRKWAAQYRKVGEAMFEKKSERRGRLPKRENTKAYIARLEMEIDLLKKYHSELCKNALVKLNIGQSTTTKKSTR